jgi:hypothetical protein
LLKEFDLPLRTVGRQSMEINRCLGFTDQRETVRVVVRTANSPDYWREFVGNDPESSLEKE